MKKISLFFLTSLFIFISCKQNNKKTNFEQKAISSDISQCISDEKHQELSIENQKNELEEQENNNLAESKSNTDSSNIISVNLTIQKLQGVWTENDMNNALFYIEGNQLYYVEDQENPIQITIYKDTLIMEGDISVKCKVIKLDKDSLCFIDNINMDETRLKKIE